MDSYISRFPRRLLFLAAIIFCSALSTTSCKKKPSPEEILQGSIRQAGQTYLSQNSLDPMEIQEIDSVEILSIDTVSSLGYTILMQEVLTNMQSNYEYDYKAALFEDDEMALREINLSMTEIGYMIEYFDMLLEKGGLRQDDILLLWIGARFSRQGEWHDFDYQTNPDGTLHSLDPFNNNLLDKDFAAE